MAKLPPPEWKASVPAGLKGLEQWVGWDGDRKLPLDLRRPGKKARVNDPKTWGTWEQAAAHYERSQRKARAGSGIVLRRPPDRAAATLVFVDFDDALDAAGALLPWTEPYLAPFLAQQKRVGFTVYCEKSPGGRGLHLFFVAAPPDTPRSGFKKKVGDGAVEVYWDRRFSTVTGQRWGGTTGLVEAQGPLDDLLAALEYRDDGGEHEPAEPGEADPGEVLDALGAVDPDCGYEDWLAVGMALKAELGEAGLKAWTDWSSRGSKYKGAAECSGKWRSFRSRGVGAGTVFKLARAAGWSDAPTPEQDFSSSTESTPTESGGDDGRSPTGAASSSSSQPASVTATGDDYERGGVHQWRACGLHIVERGGGKSLTLRPSEGDANVGLWLERHPALRGRLRLNLRTMEAELDGAPVQPHELARRCVFFMGWGRSPSEESVARAARAVAAKSSFDPVEEWLRALPPPSRRGRLDELCGEVGLADDPVTRRHVRRWMIGAVARALEPGCEMQTMLVLHGEQGMRKSLLFKRLAVRTEWYSESEVDMTSKDGQLALLGPWIVENGELAGMGRAEVDKVKVFISEKVSRFRPPYGRKVEAHPRRCALCGTTNRDEFLRDGTGSRRFWLALVLRELCLPNLYPADWAHELWAEALELYLAGERWWDEGQEVRDVSAANEEHYEGTALDSWVADLLEEMKGKRATTMAEVVRRLSEDRRLPAGARQRDVGDAMRRCGWTLCRLRVDGEARRVWNAPGETPDRGAQVLAFRRAQSDFAEAGGTDG